MSLSFSRRTTTLEDLDACQTPKDLRTRVAELLALFDLRPTLTLDEVGAAPLESLLENRNAAQLLAMIARLLVRAGDARSFGQVLTVAFRLSQVERCTNSPGRVSALLRGLGQIGLGDHEVGVKNITRGTNSADGQCLLDQPLVQWGLMSAALAERNLPLAERFCDRWRSAAVEQGLKQEPIRAAVGKLLLQILAGEASSGTGEPALEGDVPAPMQGMVLLLEAWRSSLDGGPDAVARLLDEWPAEHRETRWYQCARSLLGIHTARPLAEQIPLLLGLDWCRPAGIEPRQMEVGSFDDLCRLRRRYGFPSTLAALTSDEQVAVAEFLARWNLSKPLRVAEGQLKRADAPAFYRSVLGRIMGKHVGHAVDHDRFTLAGTTLRDEALIWMCDVVGYSAATENASPEAAFGILSPLYDLINQELEGAGGMILEFVGDSVMLVFNAFPGQHSRISTVLSSTARCLQRLHGLGALGRLCDRPDLSIGVGLTRGTIGMGYLGGLARCHVACLGNTTNTAARIEAKTRTLPYPVAVHDTVFGGAAPDVWRDPCEVNYSLRDLGLHKLKNIERESRIYGLAPLLRYWVDFVPAGFVGEPEPGVVYLDVGSQCVPGIVDHHFRDGRARSSSATLVSRPELVTEHLQSFPRTQIQFRVHQLPDLDCTSALHIACELIEGSPRMELLQLLAAYVDQIDQGFIPRPEQFADSLYGVFVAHQHLVGGGDRQRLEAGLRVVDAALYIAEAAPDGADFSTIFCSHPEWFVRERELLECDQQTYREDHARGELFQAPVGGLAEPATWLLLDHPRSVLFKMWARTDTADPGGRGHACMVVDWSREEKARYVLSVDPDAGLHLRGLGQQLEREESAQRERMGLQRPAEPRRYPADNADPWYMGWGHQFTIIDSPWNGTVLSARQIREVMAAWDPAATESEQSE